MTIQAEFLAASGNPVAIDQTTRALGVTILDGSPATLSAILAKIIAAPMSEATGAALLAESRRAMLLAGRVTVTNASATIQALLTTASMTMPANARTLTLIPATAVAMKVGAAAVVANGPTLAGGLPHEMDCLAATDIRLIAGGNVLCDVWVEGVL